jgi:predicted secreted protein
MENCMNAWVSKLALGIAVLVLVGAAALGDLCAKCREMAFTMDVGECAECAGATGSRAFKLCKKCSAKLGQCEHCRALLKGADIVLGDDANGKTIAAEVKQTLLVKLPGNPTTGYQWGLSKLEGEAIEMVGKPGYVADKNPQKMAGTGGTYHFTFRALKPGKATLTLAYARPWEKDTPPIKTFTLTVEVKPHEPKAKP